MDEVQWNVYNRGGCGLGMRSSGMCTTEEAMDWEWGSVECATGCGRSSNLHIFMYVCGMTCTYQHTSGRGSSINGGRCTCWIVCRWGKRFHLPHVTVPAMIALITWLKPHEQVGVVRVRNLREMVNPGELEELGLIKDKVMFMVHVACSQAPPSFCCLQYGKARRAWYLFHLSIIKLTNGKKI